MRQYSIIIRKINECSILVSEKSKRKTIKKVFDFLEKCLENNIDLNAFFDKKPKFKFIIKNNKSNLQNKNLYSRKCLIKKIL